MVKPVESLSPKKSGRPPLLGVDLDGKVQKYIYSVRAAGGIITKDVCIATGRAIVQGYDRTLLTEYGGSIELSKSWAMSLLHQMKFVKRKATTAKSKEMINDFEGKKKEYLAQIQACIEMESIPDELVINWDQVGLQIIPSSPWTMEREGVHRVEIVGTDSKAQITGVFAGTLNGNFLPIQLIFKGKTKRCHPKFTFPGDWHITHSDNHWSNSMTMDGYLESIIIKRRSCS